MQLSIGVGNSSKIDGYAAGLEAAGTVKEQLGDDAPDFKTNITRLFEGIEKHCNLPFIGGASGDNLKFQQCFQFHDGEVM